MSNGITFVNRKEAVEYAHFKEEEGFHVELVKIGSGTWKVITKKAELRPTTKFYRVIPKDSLERVLEHGLPDSEYDLPYFVDAKGHKRRVYLFDKLEEAKNWKESLKQEMVPIETTIIEINIPISSKILSDFELPQDIAFYTEEKISTEYIKEHKNG